MSTLDKLTDLTSDYFAIAFRIVALNFLLLFLDFGDNFICLMKITKMDWSQNMGNSTLDINESEIS